MIEKTRTKEELFNEIKILQEKISAVENEEDKIIDDKIEKFMNALPFYVMLVDSNYTILFVNEAIEELGLFPENLPGKSCPQVMHGTSEPITDCPLRKVIEDEEIMEMEFYEAKFDKWFSSAIYPVKLDYNRDLYIHMIKDITIRKQTENRLKETIDKLEKMTYQGVKTLSIIVEKKDPYTAGHQERVSKLGQAIAGKLGLSAETKEAINISGLLHDIGKITIPSEILCKPGKISEHEFNMIKTHPRLGYNILSGVDFPWPVANIILQHHERLDGSGYPQGLSAKEISLEAKILGVADVVEAMSSRRPYRPAIGIDEALKEIEINSGKLYDQLVVQACIQLFKEDNYQFPESGI